MRSPELPPVAEHPSGLGPTEDRMPDRRSQPAAVAVQLDVRGEHGLERLEIAVLHCGEEARRQLLALLLRGVESRPALIDMTSCAGGELSRVRLAGPNDLGDTFVVVVEDVVEQERRPLLRTQRLEDDEEGEGEGVRQLGLPGGIVLRSLGHGLGQPLPDVGLAPGSGRAQLVDRQASGHRGRIGPRRGDLLPLLDRVVDPQQGLLDDVLGLADAAEHPVSDRECPRTQVIVKRVAPAARPRINGLVHAEVPAGWLSFCSSPSRKPSRQLG